MTTLLQDLRYAIRTLAKKPNFTLVAIIALALGIGANTAIFSVVRAVLLRPLPYQQPGDLVLVRHLNNAKGTKQESVGYVDFQEWKAQNQVFADMATFKSSGVSFTGNDGAENLRASGVSANFFQLLGINAVKGRTFLPNEENRDSERVVLLSYALWQRVFGGDEKLIGQPIKLSNQQFTVIGVMPPNFKFPFSQEKAELWTTNAAFSAGMMDYRGARNFQVIARLKLGVSLQTAQTEMSAIAGRIEQENQQTNRDLGILLIPAQDELTKDVRATLWLLFGAVAFVLLIACSNVANLLLSRATARSKEMAIRAALGASGWRIVRQLLTESLLLSFTGGVAGLFLAAWGVKLLVAISPASLPRINSIGIDGQVLAFTLIASMLTGILFGLVPALKAARPDLNEALKDGGRTSAAGTGRNWLRGALVVGEIAFAFILLIGAALVINSFIRLNSVELGFNPENTLTAGLGFSQRKYPSGEHAIAFLQQAQERIKGLPGVRAVSFAGAAPFSGGVRSSFKINGREWPNKNDVPMTGVTPVTPDYFETMSMRLLQGRHFTDADSKTSKGAVVVNETFAREFLSNEDPLGQVVTDFANRDKDSPKEYEIVGVVASVRGEALNKEPTPIIYTAHRQTPWAWGELVIRADRDALSLSSAVRQEIRNLDSEMPINLATVESRIADSIKPQRFNLSLLTIFAVTGLLLAVVGIYGVMSYRVIEATHEIGVRIALGAQTSDVLKLVLGQGAGLTLIGVGLGIGGALGLTRLMESLLFGIKPTDSLTFVSVAIFLVLVALLACYLPARRATKVDPITTLRYE
ncbi:MAG TPA: ABC transporter permease [Blastocatellia bacterium]|nr:ABC transporter permease [Blastocatellia bacterium]